MLALERFDHMPLLISKLQRDLFEMHQGTMANVWPKYHMVLECNCENTVAQSMVQEANKGTWLKNSDHRRCIDWGTMRTDLDSLEADMQT